MCVFNEKPSIVKYKYSQGKLHTIISIEKLKILNAKSNKSMPIEAKNLTSAKL